MIIRNGFRYASALMLFIICLQGREARADSIVFDPVGDTFGTESSQIDITSINATSTQSSITFELRFASSISPASASAPNSVTGVIYIDADQNTTTGIPPALINDFSPGPAMLLGAEFSINLFSEADHPGFVDIFNSSGLLVGTAPITYTGTLLSLTVPLSLLGNSNGLLNYGVIVGTFDEPTDRGPNGATPATSAAAVPEPTSIALLSSSIAALAFEVRRRRKVNS